MKKTLAGSLPLLLALLLLAVRAGAAESAVEACRGALLAAVANEDMPREERVRPVTDLAAIGDRDAARALVEGLGKLAEHVADLEARAARTRKQFAPYSGYTFTDPKAWEIKERLQAQMEKEDRLLQAAGGLGDAIRNAFAKLSDAEALSEVTKASAKASDATARRVFLAGLLLNPATPAADLGKRALRDEDPAVRLAALEAFAVRKDPEFVELAIKALGEPGWPLRQAASVALGALGDVRAVPALVEAMAAEEGRLVEDFSMALSRLTGQTLGPYPDAWRAWYEDHKKELAEQGARPVAPKPPRSQGKSTVDYYGIQTRSLKIVFLLDVSGSMKEPIGGEPQSLTGVGSEDLSGPKIEVAKRMLRDAVHKLPKEAWFAIVYFNHEVKAVTESLVQATDDHKAKAYLSIADLEPAGATYTYGALKRAFEMAVEGKAAERELDLAVDTIFLLSDGAPTDSSVDSAKPMKPEVILDAVRGWNRDKHVRIHTIAIDPSLGTGAFLRLMKQLALENGGEYTPVGKKR